MNILLRTAVSDLVNSNMKLLPCHFIYLGHFSFDHCCCSLNHYAKWSTVGLCRFPAPVHVQLDKVIFVFFSTVLYRTCMQQHMFNRTYASHNSVYCVHYGLQCLRCNSAACCLCSFTTSTVTWQTVILSKYLQK